MPRIGVFFFLHVQGIHRWPRKRKFMELIPSEEVKVCPRWKKEKFEVIAECPHITEQTHPDSNHEPISPETKWYKVLLASVSKTAFMNDLDKMKTENMTSFVENFHSVCIKYRPKRVYFPKKGFIQRTMLAAIAYNENRMAEMRGERRISGVYPSFSKARGENVYKVRKTPVIQKWKMEIVDKTIERKQDFGKGNPREPDDGDHYEEMDIVLNRFDELLVFSDTDDDME